MPKFRGPNKKRIDPRYFLDEKMEKELALVDKGEI
tara:strand:- start:45754 stop:45858 length:105 start_codon:yes stop_codon:yes gene_type:complete